MFFLYNKIGDIMILYLDLLFLLNFSFDFILLLSVSILLRRNAKLIKVLLGSLIGSLSIFILFIKINSLSLLILKIIISIAMVIISFGYKEIGYTLKNILYLYTSSIMLGGFLYYLNLEFSYQQQGLVFYHRGLSINYLLLVILSPIIIYTYVRQGLKLKNHYLNYYELELFLTKTKKIRLTGFLDTGNKLIDPILKRPIILVSNNYLNSNLNNLKTILVPYYTINSKGLLTCIIPYKMIIKGIGIKTKFLVGIMNKDIGIEGINCILHQQLLEG